MGKGMSKVLPGLYVGGYADVMDQEQMVKYKISHVVSACNLLNEGYRKPNLDYLIIDIEDKSTQAISPHFAKAIQFIHKARTDGGIVLVHCYAGVSRSVTITAAYILSISDLTWKQAINSIRGARQVANPNFGFQHQLQEWCETERCEWVDKVKEWGAAPYNDQQTLTDLLLKHEKWVENGDDDMDEPDGGLYPLAAGAYKAKSTDVVMPEPKSEVTLGDKRRSAMREALRARILLERRFEARNAELKDQGYTEVTGTDGVVRLVQTRSTTSTETNEGDSTKSSLSSVEINSNMSNLSLTDTQPVQDDLLGAAALVNQSGHPPVEQTVASNTPGHRDSYNYVSSSDQLMAPSNRSNSHSLFKEPKRSS